jgi:TatD DNase family protein
MIKWLDAHTHLDSDELFTQKDEVLKRASEAGVMKMLLVNSEASELSFQRTLECVSRVDPVQRFASVGIHPHHASLYTPEIEEKLEQYLNRPDVIALGEIGLDFFYDFSPRDQQISVLKQQLDLALNRGLPVVIHCRDAYSELAEILAGRSKTWRGMIHCFTGTPEEADRLLQLGFHISFSGIVTFRNAGVLREAARMVPAEKILVETDAPYLAPVPHRGKKNEPSFVVFTAKFLAELRQANEETFSQNLFQNFHNLFGV